MTTPYGDCKPCHGTGKVLEQLPFEQQTYPDYANWRMVPCPACGGTGKAGE